MRRRPFLWSVGAAATLAAVGSRAHADARAGAGGRTAAGRTVGDHPADGFGPTGRVEVRHAAEGVVGDDGTTVYVASGDGFAIVDASDPVNPAVLAERRGLTGGGEPFELVQDVAVSGDRLLVVGPARAVDGHFHGFQLFDVSDPAAPERVASVGTGHPVHNAFLDGDVAYLVGTGGRRSPMVVWDVSGDDPERAGDWSVLDADPRWEDVSTLVRGSHDVYVRGDTAYVANWDAGTWLVDVSDPANPRAEVQLGGRDPSAVPATAGIADMIERPGNSHYARPSPDGSVVAVGREANDFADSERAGRPGGITLWNVDRDVPEALTVIQPPPVEREDSWNTAHNFGFRGDRLYTSWYAGGVRVYDLSTPADPALLGAWRDEAHATFWTARPAAEGFVATSVEDPSVPEQERRQRGVGDRLYTFPEPSGDPRPASTRSANRTARRVTTRATTGTTAGSPTTTTTDAGTTATDGQPGFGAAVALGAGTLAAWRRVRER